jgi:galactose mutarotase-like enzyme
MSKSRYEVEEHSGRTVDVLTNEASDARLMVARQGAEPVSLARRDAQGQWRGFLWRDAEFGKAAEGWNNHATVMGYYLHRIKGERTLYRGHEVRGGTHSFLRHKMFREPRADLADGAASLTYTMTPAEFEPHEYPFKVALHLTYTLEPGGALRVRFRFENQEPELTTHVSFGLHPGFAVNSLADCQVILPPGEYRRLLAPGNFLSGETVVINHPGGPMPFPKEELPGSYLLDLAGVPERVFTLEDPAGGRRVELDCPQAPYLTLWSDGHAFVCVEPCWGVPDHDEQRAFQDKLGLETIAPGGTLERDFSIRAILTPTS